RCPGRGVGMLAPAGGSGGSGAALGGSAGASGAGGSAGGAAAPGEPSGGAAGGALGGAGGAAAAPVEPPLCERYCDTIMAACTGDNEQYASPMACREVCDLLRPGEPGEFVGNTVECRLARAELARATGEPGSYC